MYILSHLLVSPNVTRVNCDKNRTPLVAPDTIVMHYTGGGDARSSALYLADPATKASAHVVVARDGQIFQLVPFDKRAWHAGASALAGREHVNAFSIGIELANAGRLTRRDDRWFTWFGHEIPQAEKAPRTGTPTRLCNCAWRHGFANYSQDATRSAALWATPTSPPASKTPARPSLGTRSGKWSAT